MERSRVTLIALLCVLFYTQKRICGEEVEMRVRRGDNVILYSDCVIKSGFYPVWIRNCSHENQLPLILLVRDLMPAAHPHYSAVWNKSKSTYDFLIRNVTESDLGLYYCALHENRVTKDNRSGIIMSTDVYHYGNRSTRLSLLEDASSCVTVSPVTLSPHVPGWSLCWQLVVSVGAVCALISSVLSSICVYFLCRNTSKAEVKADQTRRAERQSRRRVEDDEGELCYASLDVQKLSRTKKKKQKLQTSDFSTYSEVKT